MNNFDLTEPVVIGIDHGYGNIKTARTCFQTGVTTHDQEPTFKSNLLVYDGRYYTVGDGHKEFAGADIFPQGFSAVADRLHKFRGVNILCDIGNGTMNIMYINNGRPIPSKCFTEKYGTHQCMLAAREKLMQNFSASVDDSIIEEVIRFGKANINGRYLDVIRQSAAEYVSGIMRRLREHEYDAGLMKLYVMGGGSCLIKNFSQYDPERVEINSDIHATAKGYEAIAKRNLSGRSGGVV